VNDEKRRLAIWGALALPILMVLAFVAGRQFAAPKPKEAKLNFSRFVFRDVNRNGIYDLGDRPYGGLPVRLIRPDGSVVVRRSNLGGFANFVMSAGSRKHPISVPGDYATEPRLGDGWVLTTPIARETVTFELDPLAPGKIFGKSLYSFVGIAPEMAVSLTAAAAGSLRNVSLTIGGKAMASRAPGDGTLRFDAIAGDTGILAAEDANGRRIAREIHIGNVPILLSAAFFEFEIQSGAASTIIGFDDLIAFNTLRETPSGYGGFNWQYWITTQEKFYSLAGHLNNTVSGDYMAYSSSGHPAVISLPEPFDFVGSHIAVSHEAAESGDVILEGYLGGKLIHTERLRLRIDGPVRLEADWRGIDRLVMRHEHFWHVVIDDIELRRN
jgi:hypothetical protein